jgi:hypothetical protein
MTRTAIAHIQFILTHHDSRSDASMLDVTALNTMIEATAGQNQSIDQPRVRHTATVN